MEMTPMPKDIPWRIQIEDIINIEKDAFLNTYRMEKGGQVLKLLYTQQWHKWLHSPLTAPIIVVQEVYPISTQKKD